jgi:HK97 family phage major capsid protein
MNTAALVDNLSTAIFPVAGFIEVSNELLSDSPVAIGETIIGLYGERLKAELDHVIVKGDGVTQPSGILTATGMASVNSVNGPGGPMSPSDAESLIFSIPVQYRRKDWNPTFISNDFQYSRFRGIPVGPGDERRVFGLDQQSYTLFDWPYRIQNDLANGQVLFGCMKRYRLYRRLGMELHRETGGRQLTLNNTTLLGIRARFGGQPVDGAAFSLMTDATTR